MERQRESELRTGFSSLMQPDWHPATWYPSLGGKPGEGVPTPSPLSHAEVESGTQKMHGDAS